MQKPPLLSILMPVYNEAKTVQEIMARVEASDIGDVRKELIVVDDGSTDGTRDVLRQMEDSQTHKIYFHGHNMGKGAALRTALTTPTAILSFRTLISI
jgi:glycosyltransferase involved in cell wall biosynthesis